MPSHADDAYLARKVAGLESALQIGVDRLAAGEDAIDVVQRVVQAFEDDPWFNAGRGSVLDYNGIVSMDASLMDGRDLSCGAVANVTQVKNPVALARFVRDHTPHVLIAGAPADALAIQAGVEVRSREYFLTEEQQARWERWWEREQSKRRETKSGDSKSGDNKAPRSPDPPEDDLFRLSTVGCVARDVRGNLAAATSTGGLVGKQYGRVGDSPLIGAGTYAKNGVCAISCTGIGELFIKHQVAGSIAARVELTRASLTEAMEEVLMAGLPKDSGGAIGVDARGNVAMFFNTPVMACGKASSNGMFEVNL